MPESAEQLLASFNGAGGTDQNFRLSAVNHGGLYVKPALPPDATAWSATRLRLRVARDQASVSLAHYFVRASRPTADLKPGALIETVNLYANTMPKVGAATQPPLHAGVAFTKLTNLDPAAGLCFVVAPQTTSPDGHLGTQANGAAMPPDTHFLSSSNGGASWAAPGDTKDVHFELYGTVTTP